MSKSTLLREPDNPETLLFLQSLIENPSISWAIIKNAINRFSDAGKLNNSNHSSDKEHLFLLLVSKIIKNGVVDYPITTPSKYRNRVYDEFEDWKNNDDFIFYLNSNFNKDALIEKNDYIYASLRHKTKKENISVLHAIINDQIDVYTEKTKGLCKWLSLDDKSAFSWERRWDGYKKNIIDAILYDAIKNDEDEYPYEEINYLCNKKIDFTQCCSNGQPRAMYITQKNEWVLYLEQGGDPYLKVEIPNNSFKDESDKKIELWWYLIQKNKNQEESNKNNIANTIKVWMEKQNPLLLENQKKNRYLEKLKDTVKYHCTLSRLGGRLKGHENWEKIKDDEGRNVLMLSIAANSSAYKFFKTNKTKHLWGDVDNKGNNVFLYVLNSLYKNKSAPALINHLASYPESCHLHKEKGAVSYSGILERIIESTIVDTDALKRLSYANTRILKKLVKKTQYMDWFSTIDTNDQDKKFDKEFSLYKKYMEEFSNHSRTAFVLQLMKTLGEVFEKDMTNPFWRGITACFIISYANKPPISDEDKEKYTNLAYKLMKDNGMLPNINEKTQEDWVRNMGKEHWLAFKALSSQYKIHHSMALSKNKINELPKKKRKVKF